MHYTVLLFIRAPFYVSLVFVGMCSAFWLFWLSYQSLAKWLARKTPLRKPNHGEGIFSRKPRQKSVYDFLRLLYCFIVLLYICVVSCLYVTYFPTVIVRYSLFVLKVPLSPKQTNKWCIQSGVCIAAVFLCDAMCTTGYAQSSMLSDVCPSVCLSRWWRIVSTRLKISSDFFLGPVAPSS